MSINRAWHRAKMLWLPWLIVIFLHLVIGLSVHKFLLEENPEIEKSHKNFILVILWGIYTIILIVFCEHYVKRVRFKQRVPLKFLEWTDNLIETNQMISVPSADVIITAGTISAHKPHSISSPILEELGRTVEIHTTNHDNMDGLVKVQEWITALAAIPNKMSEDSIQAILGLAKTCSVPQVVEFAFKKALNDLNVRMQALTNGEIIPGAKIYDQYQIAAGVASYYKKQKQSATLTIWATALDRPSTFFQENQNYFASHQDWPVYGGENVAFWEVSARRQKCTESRRCRIVVISSAELLEEYKNENFWLFVSWHFKNWFDLRFLLFENKQQYSDQVNAITLEPAWKSIDDFIVYGTETVFGRVDLQPDANDFVKLRLVIKTPEVAQIYRGFFKVLWGHDHCKNLWAIPKPDESAERALFQERLDGIANDCSRFMSSSFHDFSV